MNRILSSLLVTLFLLSVTGSALAAPPPPVISHTTNGLDLTVSWTSVAGATGYILSYAPYPYQGEDTIGTLDMMGETDFPITLWEGASYYIAVQSYDSEGTSPYSNIDLFKISLETEFSPGATYGSFVLVGEEVAFTVFTSQQADVEIASINVPLQRKSSTYKFVNIVVDLNSSGSFEPYSVSGGVQNEWVVKNVPVLAYSPSYDFLLELLDPGVVEGSSLDVRVVITTTPIDEATPWNGAVSDNAVGRDVQVTTDGQVWTVTSAPDETSIGGGSGQVSPAKITRGPDDVPARDESVVDGTLYRAGMPDGNQGLNQCVAQSVANSLSWLSRRYDFTDKLDKAYDEDYTAEEKDHTTNEGAGILGGLVNDAYTDLGVYNPATGVVGTPGATSFAEALPGLKTNILKGKDKFVADNNLPIESSIIEVGAGSDLFTEIKKAMQDEECAVEVIVEVFDDDNKTIGGHAVSVSGFADLPIGSTHYKGLTFHDGQTVNESVSEPGNDTYPLNGDTIENLPFVGRDNKLKLRKARLSFAVKQCYKPVEVGCWDGYFGMHDFYASFVDDSAGHSPYIGNPFSSPVTILNGGSQMVSVTGYSPFVNVTGTSSMANGSCRLTATGQGTVAGIPNVSVTLDLTANSGSIFGTYQMGSNGGLYGVPITYTIEAQ